MDPEKYQCEQKRPVFDKGDFNSLAQKLPENKNVKRTVAITTYHEKNVTSFEFLLTGKKKLKERLCSKAYLYSLC